MGFEEINRKLSLLAIAGIDDTFHIVKKGMAGKTFLKKEGYKTLSSKVLLHNHSGKQLSLFN
tara:strand:- start:1945 stop:2130 length:186 start_codon:yes stop_codon:yes gene_type:complete